MQIRVALLLGGLVLTAIVIVFMSQVGGHLRGETLTACLTAVVESKDAERAAVAQAILGNYGDLRHGDSH
ncbi:hypothetical protein [Roseateles chitinivorans]|uniref:hypothetical protein n=1 Tax=Roseateles chitinivorans TaxID=2917965 RepID=UPI003D6734D7